MPLRGQYCELESFSEIEALRQIAHRIPVAVGLRMNFDLERVCSSETDMGNEPSRFDFCLENGDFERAFKRCAALNMNVIGMHMYQSTRTRGGVDGGENKPINH